MNGPSGNLIGGTAAVAGNVIAFNGAQGVLVMSGTGDAILGNSIFSNTSPGIVLAPGGNNDQPAPVITNVTTSSLTTVDGTLSAAPNTTYRLEFFDSPAPGTGEGKVFLASTDVTTDGTGTATFSVLTIAVPTGDFVTATATSPTGDTSAFSNAFAAP